MKNKKYIVKVSYIKFEFDNAKEALEFANMASDHVTSEDNIDVNMAILKMPQEESVESL